MVENKLILDYLQKNYKDGDRIGSFDGGNDSGWVEMETEEFQDEIRELVEEELGYGSWAGNFEASGLVIFRNNAIEVEGDERDYENLRDIITFEKVLNLPKGIHSMEVAIEPDITDIKARVFNGYVPKDVLIKEEEKLRTEINDWIDSNDVDELDNYYNWARTLNGSTLYLEAGNYDKINIDYKIEL